MGTHTNTSLVPIVNCRTSSCESVFIRIRLFQSENEQKTRRKKNNVPRSDASSIDSLFARSFNLALTYFSRVCKVVQLFLVWLFIVYLCLPLFYSSLIHRWKTIGKQAKANYCAGIVASCKRLRVLVSKLSSICRSIVSFLFLYLDIFDCFWKSGKHSWNLFQKSWIELTVVYFGYFSELCFCLVMYLSIVVLSFSALFFFSLMFV